MQNWTNVFLFIAGVAVSFLGAVSKYLFDKVQDHEKRVQKMEDLHGSKIDNIERKIDRLEQTIDRLEETIRALADNIHKEKNQENQLS